MKYRDEWDDNPDGAPRVAPFVKYIPPHKWGLYRQAERAKWNYELSPVLPEHWKAVKKQAAEEVAASSQYDWDKELGSHVYTRQEIAQQKGMSEQDVCWDCEDPYDAVDAANQYDWDD